MTELYLFQKLVSAKHVPHIGNAASLTSKIELHCKNETPYLVADKLHACDPVVWYKL